MPHDSFRICEKPTTFHSVSRKGWANVVRASGVMSKVENMSNYSTTLDARGATETSVQTAPGLWQRFYKALVAAREEQARREIERYFSSLSPEQLKDLGYPASADRR